MPGEFVNSQFSEPSSILPLHEYFQCEFLEVHFLVAPTLCEAWTALFEILKSMICHVQIPNDWKNLSLKFTDCNIQESLLHILASILQILPLRVDVLFVLQEPVSQHFPIQRICIELHFLLELLDVPKKYLLCRNVIHGSAFFCLRTLLQVSLHFLGSETNLTLSLLCGR